MHYPSLNSLGKDLTQIHPLKRIWALLRPFLFILLFIILYQLEIYWSLPFVVFMLFVSVIYITHDLVHQTLQIPPLLNELLIALYGGLILESGHSYQITHHLHHKNFPHDEDPEGAPAKTSFIKSILIGPLYIPKLFIWSYHYTTNKQLYVLKKWLIIELIWVLFFILLSCFSLYWTSILLTYSLMVIFGGWFYSLITVYLPHHQFKKAIDSKIWENTIHYRGKFSSLLFMNLIYHLEHHMYPQVPTQNLHKLSQRLQPFFEEKKNKIHFKKLL